jgi:hypothetical protein
MVHKTGLSEATRPQAAKAALNSQQALTRLRESGIRVPVGYAMWLVMDSVFFRADYGRSRGKA